MALKPRLIPWLPKTRRTAFSVSADGLAALRGAFLSERVQPRTEREKMAEVVRSSASPACLKSTCRL